MVDWSLLHTRIHRLAPVDKSSLPGQQGLLPRRAHLLVAVSGGQDSLCLLKLLSDLQRKWHWRLTVVHCDHRWRSDSAENAAFVARLADQWGLPCEVVTAAVPPRSEAAARHWRYGVFEQLAIERGCGRVVTGHTATDRAETLLYNLTRGSGADGLQALTWQRHLNSERPEIQLVRPLLDVDRAETAAFCRDFSLPIWQDRTNEDRTYARNRIRLDLMPYLRSHLNPNAEQALAQTAEILSAEVELLEQLAESLYWQVVIVPLPGQPWQIRRNPLKTLHLAIGRRVLRRVLRNIVPGQVTFDQVEKLVGLVQAPNRSQSDPFPGGAIARVEHDLIVIG